MMGGEVSYLWVITKWEARQWRDRWSNPLKLINLSWGYNPELESLPGTLKTLTSILNTPNKNIVTDRDHLYALEML